MNTVSFDSELSGFDALYEAAVKKPQATNLEVAFNALAEVAKSAKKQDMTLYSLHHEDFYNKYSQLVTLIPQGAPERVEKSRKQAAIAIGLEEDARVSQGRQVLTETLPAQAPRNRELPPQARQDVQATSCGPLVPVVAAAVVLIAGVLLASSVG